MSTSSHGGSQGGYRICSRSIANSTGPLTYIKPYPPNPTTLYSRSTYDLQLVAPFFLALVQLLRALVQLNQLNY